MAEEPNSFFQGWQDDGHVKMYDWFSYFPTPLFLKQFEYFNELRLLKEYFQKHNMEEQKIYEIGCATGELFRYLNTKKYRCKYHGFDVSENALRAAKEKYPKGNFSRIQENTRQVFERFGQADVVFSRDVIQHQTDVWGFLDSLIELTRHSLIMRIRTRDAGATCLDPELSCQAHYGKYWMPYIVINTDELCEHVGKFSEVKKINILNSYGILGGDNKRFVPKELYFSEAGTAETSILIEKGPREGKNIEITSITRSDKLRLSLFERAWLKLWLMKNRPT